MLFTVISCRGAAEVFFCLPYDSANLNALSLVHHMLPLPSYHVNMRAVSSPLMFEKKSF